jgi:hypothetical protein
MIGEHKDLYCSRCGTVTNHVSVSFEEYTDQPASTIDSRGIINNLYTNLLGLSAKLVYGTPYRCCNCGRQLRRDKYLK